MGFYYFWVIFMNMIKADKMWYSVNNPFGLREAFNDDIDEDVPLFWIDNCGFILINKAQVLQAEYHFQRNLHIGDCGQTLSDFYTLLGVSAHIKKCITGTGHPDADRYGWNMEYIYDMGYSWLDIYHRLRTTKSGQKYYEFEFELDPIDLEIPYDW